MRLLTAFAVATLLGSAFWASRHYAARAPVFPPGLFSTADPAQRAREGVDGKELGVALNGYEELVRRNPDDLDAIRGRIRVAFMISAVGLAQPDLPEYLVQRAQEYLAQRQRLDPDGAFLRDLARQWIGLRLEVDPTHQIGFYARASAAIFAAARGDAPSLESVLGLTRLGAFDIEFFPFARRYHPAWSVTQPLIAHYLEHGNVGARVEAGAVLLDYEALFGLGGDMVESHLPVIRSSIREMLQRVHAFADDAAADCGRAAILGLALLANRGDADALHALTDAKGERELAAYAPHADMVRIARLCAGIDSFESMTPLSVRFKDLDAMDQEAYYLAVAHRAAHLVRQGAPADEVVPLFDLLEVAFESTNDLHRIFPMQALLRLAPERGAAAVRKGMVGRGTFSVYASAVAEGIEDRPAQFLPYMASPSPEVAALAAANLLDLPAPYALER